jgi:hypothetical protein
MIIELVIVLACIILFFIKPKSKPIDPGSDFLKEKSGRCLDLDRKIAKKISETKRKLWEYKTDMRLVEDRARSIRKIVKSGKSYVEMDAELIKLDRTIFKDVLDKYPEKRQKKSKKNVLKKDQKEILENKVSNKPKRRSKKNLEDYSNE